LIKNKTTTATPEYQRAMAEPLHQPSTTPGSHSRSTAPTGPDPDKQLLTILDKLGLPLGTIDMIDLSLFRIPITEDSSNIHRDLWIIGRLYSYSIDTLAQGEELFARYSEDFEGWTISNFESLDPDIS